MISFSGIDCSGKSTQIELLCKSFDEKKRKYKVVWSRGGYTPGINLVKKILRHGKNMTKDEIIAYSQKTDQSSRKRKILYLAGIIDLWFYYSIILRIQGISKTIICDRYIWDTYIDYKLRYSDYDFENGFWWRLILKTMVKPSPSICLFIPAEESMRRSGLKDEPFPEPIEVRRERIEWYLKECKNKRWSVEVDATQPVIDVFKCVECAVEEAEKSKEAK